MSNPTPPIVGHWYASASNHLNPRKVLAVKQIGTGYDITYHTVGGIVKSCWYSTWEAWAVMDLGEDWKKETKR